MKDWKLDNVVFFSQGYKEDPWRVGEKDRMVWMDSREGFPLPNLYIAFWSWDGHYLESMGPIKSEYFIGNTNWG